jgi:sortase A
MVKLSRLSIASACAAAVTFACAVIWFVTSQNAQTIATAASPNPTLSVGISALPQLDAQPSQIAVPTKTDNLKVIGTLSIPTARINGLGITRGVDQATLDTGLAGAYEWSGPGETGVFAMAAHRMGAGAPFGSLNQTHVGDYITVTADTHNYVYQVTRVQEVSPNDVSVLNGSADKSQIVLITCTPIPEFTKRLVVTGELVRAKS